MTYLSIRIYQDLCAYKHTQHRIPDTKTSQIKNIQLWLIFLYVYLFDLSLNGWHALFCITNNRHGITITTHAIKRHFLIGWRLRQPTKCWWSCVLVLKYIFVFIAERDKETTTLWLWSLVWNHFIPHSSQVSIYLRQMGYKTIKDSTEPRLESFLSPIRRRYPSTTINI